ncbi:Pyrimidine pathway regulatory protein 1 [Colletotrichum fructicola Nara gc5]|uniref:Pyrimidine pathway regulatory protein 1 n=1 Tax=Colletotrichum fructicola (strain Nara gc5) TaxID=1213859 RepID=A0A7J6J192_COLFN|nr:Pyrimidine pathway regulatory protein 1 [Colletotrichum fructicola]KAF4483166.1 Pyrimidine pathway regulatory protein 1 [Colletotrichum fructicola Nara gc5]
MATPGSGLPYDPTTTTAASEHPDQPPAKRAKTQACSRCRRRKQKCDDQRPCANCARSGEQCSEAAPSYHYHPRPSSDHLSSTHTPLAWLGDIASLEERISRLEESNARLQDVVDRNGLALDSARAEGAAQTSSHEEGHHHRRQVSFASRSGETSLTRSSPAIGLLATFARSDEDSNLSPLTFQDGSATATARRPVSQHGAEGSVDRPTEETLFNVYHDKVHCRYPFLRLDDFRDPVKRPSGVWASYFVNMIISIGLLLDKSPTTSDGTSVRHHHSHQSFYRTAVTKYLSHVFAQPDRLLHIQAYLLLAMHAIYSPSTERIISIASATMRYCVMAQLHRADAEPPPLSVAAKIDTQMRRRVFWSAYTLDRAVGTMFDLPFSVPDYQITVKMYANVDDADLAARCAASFPADPDTGRRLTGVSAALHVVYCRQIQSEILNTTLHRDFDTHFDRASHWRLRVLEKLDRWRALCHRYSDTSSPLRNFTSSEWLHMIYNYSLAMLYQPTKATAAGPAGDWTVKSCVQACLIFRRFQRETPITELWLGLVAQFKCGVALLYCFFATPPHLRTAAYELPDASEAVRACSIVLSILAERWPQSKCLRDAFDTLAREVPLFEPKLADAAAPRKMRRESADALMAAMPQLEVIVVHRNTLRMIREMAQEEFPRPPPDAAAQQQKSLSEIDVLAEATAHLAEEDSPSWRTSITGDIFQPITPHFFQANVPLDADSFDYTALGFPGEFDLLDR